jgi:hypothetical protein
MIAAFSFLRYRSEEDGEAKDQTNQFFQFKGGAFGSNDKLIEAHRKHRGVFIDVIHDILRDPNKEEVGVIITEMCTIDLDEMPGEVPTEGVAIYFYSQEFTAVYFQKFNGKLPDGEPFAIYSTDPTVRDTSLDPIFRQQSAAH